MKRFWLCLVFSMVSGALSFGALNDILNNHGEKTDWTVPALILILLGYYHSYFPFPDSKKTKTKRRTR